MRRRRADAGQVFALTHRWGAALVTLIAGTLSWEKAPISTLLSSKVVSCEPPGSQVPLAQNNPHAKVIYLEEVHSEPPYYAQHLCKTLKTRVKHAPCMLPGLSPCVHWRWKVLGNWLLRTGPVGGAAIPDPFVTAPIGSSSHLIQSLLSTRIHWASTWYPVLATGVWMQHGPWHPHTYRRL